MNLKERLDQGDRITAPGVFDPFSARIAQTLGFPALYMTGYGVNATLLGRPDAGFASDGEMTGRLRAITDVVETPVIADGDTGFGGLPNVERAVRGYERAGAAAIQLEDQEFPKRCGHTRNRRVVDPSEMVNKVSVAVQSRESTAFLIVARTDALSQHGVDEALRRAEAYLKAGADILFIESPESEAQMAMICERFAGTPLLANMVAGGSTPLLSDQVLFELGYQVVIHPIYLLGAALSGMQRAAGELSSQGSEAGVADINALNELLDFQHIWDFDEKYGR